MLDASTMKSMFNGPEAAQALQVMRDLVDAGAARSLTVDGGDASHIGGQSTAMMVCGCNVTVFT